jgi:hypothetical protein
MFRKTLLVLVVLTAFGGAAGCLTGGGRTGGGAPASNPILAPVVDGAVNIGRSEGGGLPSSEMGGGGGGSAGTTGDEGDGGGGYGGGGPDDITSGTGNAAPIIAVGTPLGQTPGPHCLPIGSRLVFSDAVLAVTGKTDDLGRREILLKSFIAVHYPTGVTEGFTSRSVVFRNPDKPDQIYGHTAPWNGCVFARIFAPPEAEGETVRLSVSDLVCAPESPVVTEGIDSFAMSRRSFGGGWGAGGLSAGLGSTTGVLDVVLPEETAAAALEDCGAFDWRDDLRNDALMEQYIQNRLEKAQENDSDASSSKPWKDSIMQRGR